ncbi:hypothetical protein J6590_077251 [Homalodisca vitripennis]|nr:hypothetical protein J6590_077251 [Homalodisca vitripennis]
MGTNLRSPMPLGCFDSYRSQPHLSDLPRRELHDARCECEFRRVQVKSVSDRHIFLTFLDVNCTMGGASRLTHLSDLPRRELHDARCECEFRRVQLGRIRQRVNEQGSLLISGSPNQLAAR